MALSLVQSTSASKLLPSGGGHIDVPFGNYIGPNSAGRIVQDAILMYVSVYSPGNSSPIVKAIKGFGNSLPLDIWHSKRSPVANSSAVSGVYLFAFIFNGVTDQTFGYTSLPINCQGLGIDLIGNSMVVNVHASCWNGIHVGQNGNVYIAKYTGDVGSLDYVEIVENNSGPVGGATAAGIGVPQLGEAYPNGGHFNWVMDGYNPTHVGPGGGTSGGQTPTHNAVPASNPMVVFSGITWAQGAVIPYPVPATIVQNPTVISRPSGQAAYLSAGEGTISVLGGTTVPIPLEVVASPVRPAQSGPQAPLWVIDSPGGWAAITIAVVDPPPPPTFDYHGWEYIPTTGLNSRVIGNPATCVWKDKDLHLFVRGQDNNVYWNNLLNDKWSSWINLGGEIVSDPTVCSFGPGSIELFGLNAQGNVMHRRMANWQWQNQGWENLGGSCRIGPNYRIGCASMAFGRIDIFVTGTDNVIYQRTYRNLNPAADTAGNGKTTVTTTKSGTTTTTIPSSWGTWNVFVSNPHSFVTSLDATAYGYNATSGGSLATNDVGGIEVVGVAGSGQVWHRSYNSAVLNGFKAGGVHSGEAGGAGWQTWDNIGGEVIGPASIATLNGFNGGGEGFDIVVRGSDGRLWSNHWSYLVRLSGSTYSAGWNGWKIIGGPINGSGNSSTPSTSYGYLTQFDTSDLNQHYQRYSTWDTIVLDSNGALRRVAWYGTGGGAS